MIVNRYNKTLRRRQLNFLLHRQSGELFWVGRSVAKMIIIILRFRVNTSKNKKISVLKLTYERDHISLFHDSTMPTALNCLSIFYLRFLFVLFVT